MVIILLSILYGLIVTLFVTYEYLAISKWLKNRDRKKMEAWKASVKDDLLMYFQTGILTKSLVQLNPLYSESLEELLEAYRQILETPEELAHLYELAAQNFKQKYEKALFHKRWSIRMNVLHLIEAFQVKGTLEKVLNFYKTHRLSEEERVQVLRILAVFGYQPIVELLVDLKKPLAHSAYFSIFKRMDERTFDRLIKQFDRFDPAIQLDILDAIKERKATAYSKLVEKQLLHGDKEVRIHAIKAILDMAFISNPEPLFKLSSSENWEERMMVARFLGRFRKDEFLPQLEQLLEDRSWWVRNAAAQSILQYENGQSHLEYLREHHSDQFAKEMANNWLTREGVYGN